MYINERRHEKLGILYPSHGRQNGGYFSHRPLIQMDEPLLANTVKKIWEQTRASNCKSVFLSSEAFCENLHYMKATARIVEALGDEFGRANVKIILFVRNHFEYVESAYAQFLKGGIFQVPHQKVFRDGPSTLNKFVAVSKKRLGYNFFSFSSVIELLSEQTGIDHLDVYSVDRSDLQGRDIVEVIADRFGLKNSKIPSMRNRRFPPKALMALNYSISQVGFKNTKPIRDNIVEAFEAQPQGFMADLHVSDKLFDRVERESKRDKVFFAERFSGNFESVFSIPAETHKIDGGAGSLTWTDQDRLKVDRILSEAQNVH